jgi:hypothetical protein
VPRESMAPPFGSARWAHLRLHGRLLPAVLWSADFQLCWTGHGSSRMDGRPGDEFARLPRRPVRG